LITYKAIYKDSFTDFSIDSLSSYEFKSIKPKSGWKDFIQDIYKMGILTLPDYSTIKNYPSSTDAGRVIFEMSTKKIYQCYNYQDPFLAQANTNEVNDAATILSLFEKEFSIRLGEKY